MAMKKKKAGKTQTPKTGEVSGPKTHQKSGSPSLESTHPVFVRLGMSVGILLDRTRAYFTRVTKA
jgi:hypothetical protein